jgi:hypothetical protein
MAELELRRHRIREELRAEYEAFLEERIDRWLEIDHQPIIGGHHFAAASTECLQLYRDGFFIAAVMASHAVAEGIRNFLLERNSIKRVGKCPEQLRSMVEARLLTPACAAAFERIWGSFRNDVHHMNPKVATIPFRELAKRNLEDICRIEREVFEFRIENGKLYPARPSYWNVNADGTVSAYLRLS